MPFRCRSKFAQEDRVIRRGVGIESKHRALNTRGNLLEHLNPFSDQGKINEGEAGDIAAGARQGGHETLSNWIVNEAKHDWDGVGCLFQGCNNRIQTYTTEVVRSAPDVIVCSSTPTSTTATDVSSGEGASKPSIARDQLSKRQQLRQPNGTLTQGQMNAVLASFKAGIAPSRIARQFGISQSDVRKVLAPESRRTAKGQ
jgi:hypothetical protein